MPELAEVETVIRTLEHQLGNKRINSVDVYYDKMIDNMTSTEFKDKLEGEIILNYKRIGKYIVIETSHYNLVVHLRMEGKFYIMGSMDRIAKHTHVVLRLDGCSLHYNDTRKFGKMYLYDKAIPLMSTNAFKHVGLDVFDSLLDTTYLIKSASKRSTSIKAFLLDQSVMAGVGNIYADEICFACKLHPSTSLKALDDSDYEAILHHTRRILKGAIKAGGTTIRSYTSSLGVSGRFQLELKVHSRENQACYVCNTTIKKIRVAGRGTSICLTCQKLKQPK
ncbi:MAG: bifunctional DNA-formamidopyrimidine glycosylase/DNA-(apurinic or apyrimidinic site) lyase [Erysipelotrichaceae bacterium]